MLRLTLIVFISTAVLSAGIITNTICSTSTGTMTDPNACTFNDAYVQTSASAAGSFQTVGGFFEIRLSNSAFIMSHPLRSSTVISSAVTPMNPTNTAHRTVFSPAGSQRLLWDSRF